MPIYLLITHKLKEKAEKAEQLSNLVSLHIVFEPFERVGTSYIVIIVYPIVIIVYPNNVIIRHP